MIQIQILSNFFIFFISLIGVALNSGNVLKILISVELLLLSSNLNFVFYSLKMDDFFGQIYSLFILTIAACESAVGLAILVCFFRVYGTINLLNVSLRGI